MSVPMPLPTEKVISQLLEQAEPTPEEGDWGRDPESQAARAKIPLFVYLSLRRYADERTPVGGFLAAVLSNNLERSIAKADAANLALLPNIVRYMYNHMPGNCWGSSARVDAWLNNED